MQSPIMLYSGDSYEEDFAIGIWKSSSKYTGFGWVCFVRYQTISCFFILTASLTPFI